MANVQPGQVVEVNGLPYLVLGTTQTEYSVGEKVLLECEDLIVDPATSTIGVKGLEVVGRGNGQAVDSVVGLLDSGEEEKAYTSVIVALVPHLSIATRLSQSIKGALPVKDLHVTLTHLGKVGSLRDRRQAIEDVIGEIATVTPPIRYKVGGHGRFLGVEDDGTGDPTTGLDAVYASVDSPQLPDLHKQLVDALTAAGVEVSSDHGFTPHITLAYTKDKEWAPDLKPLYGVADRLVLCWGDEQKGFQLRGSVGYVRKRQESSKDRWVTIRGKPVLVKGPSKPKGAALAASVYQTGDRPRRSGLTGKVTPGKGEPLPGDSEILSGWDGDRLSVARQALYDYRGGTSDVILTKDGDETVGVVGISAHVWENVSPVVGGGKGRYREIYDVATKRAGYGHRTMIQAASVAAESGSGVFLKAIPSARGFYEAIGMRKGADIYDMPVYYWTPEDVKAAASWSTKAKSPADLEPEDGVFVDSKRGKRQQEKSMPSISTDTKKGRWVTVHGRPVFIAKARGTPSGAGGSPRFDRDRWGAMSVGDRVSKWEALSEAQRDNIADAATSVPEHQTALTSHAGARPDLKGDDVSGAIDSRINALTVKDGEPYIPSEDARMVGSTVHDFDAVLKEAGLSPEQRYQFTMEAADALVAQNREAMGRTLGDHGIYHIRGNIDNTMGILAAHPDADPAEARAAAYIANIFHDTGYMAPPAQMFLDAGHPRWSQQHYDENLRPMVKEAFGGRMAGNVSHLIRTHAATNIDWQDDVLGSAVRVADNVALFQSQKLPPLFRHVPGATNVIEQLSLGRIDAGQAQRQLTTLLNGTNLSGAVKTQLAKGIPEVWGKTGKFTLGMLGGDILGFGWQDNALTVRLGRNAEADRLQKVLDLGQRQFAKFAKTYGVDPDQFTESLQFEFKDPGGRTLLRSTIEEMKALLRMMEGIKAGRWRTLKDGRQVMVSGPIRSGITIGGGRTRLTIKGKVNQSKVQQAVDAFEALPAWQRRNVKALVLDSERGYGVSVGGQAYTAGGEFDANRVATIYNANKTDKREMARRISHEAGHGAFRDMGTAVFSAEQSIRYEHPDWMTKSTMTTPARVKPEYMDRASAEHPILGAESRFRQAFQRQDGVTPYSKQWTRQEGKQSTIARNETFAELSEMYTTSVQRNGVRAARSLLPSQAGAREVAQAFLDVIDVMDRSRGGKALGLKAAKGSGERTVRATFDDNWEPVPAGPRATHLVEIETDKTGSVQRITYFDAVGSAEKAYTHWHTLSNGHRIVVVPLSPWG